MKNARTEMLLKLGPPDRRSQLALSASCLLIVLLLVGWGVLCSGLLVTSELIDRPALALFGMFAAVVLALPYLFIILWLDRNEPEPPLLLATAVAWGAVVATSVSIVGNGILGSFFKLLFGETGLAEQLTASISAPLVEECSKGFALLVIYALFKRYFDNVLDGIIYGALVGLGFAVFENFMYYMRPEHLSGTLIMIWLRGIVTAPGTHMCFSAIFGASIGAFRVRRAGVLRWILPPLGLALAMFAHFVWNTLTMFFGSNNLLVDLVIATPLAVVFLQVPFLLLVGLTALLALRHERFLIERFLASERPPTLFERERVRLLPARRRTWHGLTLILRARIGDALVARKRNRLLIALAFQKWHMHEEAQLGSDDAQHHAIRVASLRRLLSAMPEPPA